MCVACVNMRLWKSENNVVNSVLSFHLNTGFEDRTWVVSFLQQACCPVIIQLASSHAPLTLFLKNFFHIGVDSSQTQQCGNMASRGHIFVCVCNKSGVLLMLKYSPSLFWILATILYFLKY